MRQPSFGRSPWRRDQLLVAFALYCRLPFGRLHHRNPDIVHAAEVIGRTPSALAMKLSNIASLDPEITDTGREGLKAASAGDRALWREMHDDWDRFATESRQALAAFGLPTDEDAEPAPQPAPRDGEDRLAMRPMRVGQSFFRNALLSAYDSRCCVTGLSNPHLLTASHIVPWREDRRNRLNPRNGLLLSALHDKAFDAGLMSVADDFTVLVCESVLSTAEDPFLATAMSSCHGQRIRLPTKFLPAEDFLAYHRRCIFHG